MRANSPKKRCPILWFHNHSYRVVMHLSVRWMFIFDPAQGRIKRPRGLGQIRVRRVTIFFSAQNLGKSKKSHHVRRYPIFRTKSSVEKEKKRSIRPQAIISAETSQNFHVSMIWHVFTVQKAEMRGTPQSAGYGATARFAHCLIWPWSGRRVEVGWYSIL